jgi:hypothetical protein
MYVLVNIVKSKLELCMLFDLVIRLIFLNYLLPLVSIPAKLY